MPLWRKKTLMPKLREWIAWLTAAIAVGWAVLSCVLERLP